MIIHVGYPLKVDFEPLDEPKPPGPKADLKALLAEDAKERRGRPKARG